MDSDGTLYSEQAGPIMYHSGLILVLSCGIRVSRKAAPGDGAQTLLYILGMAAWSPLAGGISASLSPIHQMTVAMGEVPRGLVSERA